MADALDSAHRAENSSGNAEQFLETGYALFFEALLNEPLLDLMLFHASDDDSNRAAPPTQG